MGCRVLFPAMATATLVIVLLHAAAGESETNLVFYMHDNVSGNNVTAFTVAGLNGTSSDPGKFGTIVVNWDAATKGVQVTGTADPDNIVGRIQGTYVNTNLVTGLDFLMLFTVIFEDMEYRGSTLEFHGTDKFFAPHRELAVVGGTGKFRFARGYAILTTEVLSGPNAVVKFNTTIRY